MLVGLYYGQLSVLRSSVPYFSPGFPLVLCAAILSPFQEEYLPFQSLAIPSLSLAFLFPSLYLSSLYYASPFPYRFSLSQDSVTF